MQKKKKRDELLGFSTILVGNLTIVSTDTSNTTMIYIIHIYKLL